MKQILAVWIGKIIFLLTRVLRIGGGSAAPGLYALKLDSRLVNKLSAQIPQNSVITGTNGKTTTARLLSHLVSDQNLKVIRNSTGSNLERGVASSLIAQANWLGKIKDIDLGIWELDEAAFNKVVFQIKPQIIVFLNAFRDQLDRYGEVDSVVAKWWNSLLDITWDTLLVINVSDMSTGYLSGIVDGGGGMNVNPHLSVTSFKVSNYTIYHESSLRSSPNVSADFEAKLTKNLGLKGTEIDLNYPQGKLHIRLPVPGPYHIFDLLAALSVYYHLNLPLDNLNQKLESFSPAFGRVEKVKLGKHEGFVFLIKNPAGASAVFETIAPEIQKEDTLLMALNDNFADGTDVSWIWDAQFERLLSSIATPIICSGVRAEDLALRLKYAGFKESNIIINPNLDNALTQAHQAQGRIFILPTYTALLQLQKLFAKNGIKEHYWKE